MADFTVYGYQCCPVPTPVPGKGETEHEVFQKLTLEAKAKADANMKIHQQIIDGVLTKDAVELFKFQKEGAQGKLEDCLAFLWNNKAYPFIVLLPKGGEMGNGIFMLRIAKLSKKTREVNWRTIIERNEPSALVIIDNRHDQQRILIEHKSEWGSTDAVRNVLRGALDIILRKKYNLTIRIEPVWQKSDFWVALDKYKGYIQDVEFDVGYPNMGRTGNKLLQGIKEECKEMYASPTMKFSVPKEARKKMRRKKGEPQEPAPALNLDPDYQDGLMGELWENCRQNGRTAKLTLTDKRTVIFGRKPKNVVNKMSEEERKAYEKDHMQMYSTWTTTFSDDVSKFNGQDDLFENTKKEIEDGLTALSTRNE